MLNEITGVFRNVLDDNKLVINESTNAGDIDDWDSLTHIELIIGVEKKFKIRFNTNEINTWANVGEMCNAIDKLLPA
jgi:acyl carrier protein